MTPTSWILELRERLAVPPPLALATEGRKQAALAPLFVDQGELWLLLRGPDGEELVPAAATLATAPIEGGEDAWAAAERSAAGMGLDPSTVLRLGTLDQVPSPDGEVIVPCVAAVPSPLDPEARPGGQAAVRLPLQAARVPHLLEERRTVIRGVEAWVTVAHFGPVKLAGAEVEIVELLLERVFHGGGN